MHSIAELVHYSGTGYAGPAQMRLTQQLFGGERRRLVSGSIYRCMPTADQLLDALAYCYDLIPVIYLHSVDPLGVVMLSLATERCHACGTATAVYAVPRASGGRTMHLCRQCALSSVANRRLGLGQAQRLVFVDDIPRDVLDLARTVAAELGRTLE